MSLGRIETYHRQRDDETRTIEGVRAVPAARPKQETIVRATGRHRGDSVPAEQFSRDLQEIVLGVAESEEREQTEILMEEQNGLMSERNGGGA